MNRKAKDTEKEFEERVWPLANSLQTNELAVPSYGTEK